MKRPFVVLGRSVRREAPLMKNRRCGRSQQRQNEAFEPFGFSSCWRIRSCNSDDAVEYPMNYCIWWVISPAEIFIGVQRQLAFIDISIKGQRFPCGPKETDVDKRCSNDGGS